MTGNKINWQDLAADLAASTGMQRKEAEAFVRTFFDALARGITQDKAVKVKALGTFKMVEVQDRESVNVNTGERFTISGHAKIGFLPDNALKELVNKPFADFQTVILNEGTTTEDMEKIDREFPSSTDEDDGEGDTPTPDNAPAPAEAEAPQEDAEAEAPAASMPDTDRPQEAETPTVQEVGSPAAQDSTPQETDVQEAPATQETPAGTAEDTDVPAAQPQAAQSPSVTKTAKATPAPKSTATAKRKNAPARPQAMASATQTAQTPPATQAATIAQETAPAPSQEEAPQQPGGTHNVWRTLFFTLVGLLLLLASYMVGYLRLIDLSWLCLPPSDMTTETPAQDTPAKAEAPITRDTTEAAHPDIDMPTIDKEKTRYARERALSEGCPLEEPAALQTEEKQSQPKDMEDTEQEDRKRKLNAARYYPQVKGGKYLITGIIKTRTMQRGDNLYRMARQEYGNKEAVEYIKTLNQLANPDNIPVGYEVKLPELTEKSE